MTCDEFLRRLDTDGPEGLEPHCPSCAKALADARRLEEGFAGLRRRMPRLDPAQVTRRVLEADAAARRAIRRSALAAAGLLAALAVGPLVGRDARPDERPAARAPEPPAFETLRSALRAGSPAAFEELRARPSLYAPHVAALLDGPDEPLALALLPTLGDPAAVRALLDRARRDPDAAVVAALARTPSSACRDAARRAARRRADALAGLASEDLDEAVDVALDGGSLSTMASILRTRPDAAVVSRLACDRRPAAADLLAAVGTAPAVRALLARGEEELLVGKPVLAPRVREALADPARRAAAARVLGRLGDPDAAGPLAAVLDDARARPDVLEALARIGTERSLELLADAARSPEARRPALLALAGARGGAATRTLVACALDPRVPAPEASDALRRRPARDVVPGLLEGLESQPTASRARRLLRDVTGTDRGRDPESWKKWWSAQKLNPEG